MMDEKDVDIWIRERKAGLDDYDRLCFFFFSFFIIAVVGCLFCVLCLSVSTHDPDSWPRLALGFLSFFLSYLLRITLELIAKTDFYKQILLFLLL